MQAPISKHRPHLLHQAAAVREPHQHVLPAAVHMDRGAPRLRAPHEQLAWAPQLYQFSRPVGSGDVEAAAMLQHDFGDLRNEGSGRRAGEAAT